MAKRGSIFGAGLALALWLAPALLPARVYFITKGVKYHIGDSRFSTSKDTELLETYPVVGTQWIQGFQVSQPDTVKVSIRSIWGVDDCEYCKNIVSIDDHDMGRLFEENNHKPFETLEPLAFHAEPGRTYFLKIESHTSGGRGDDFVVADVSVETAVAEVKFTAPGPVIKMPEEPMPPVSVVAPVPVPVEACAGLEPLKDWQLGPGKGKDIVWLKDAPGKFTGGLLGTLAPGQTVDFYVRAGVTGVTDEVSRALEVLCGEKGESGWVFTLDQAGALTHGNLKVNGDYRSQRLDVSRFLAGQWNRVGLSYCTDGRLWLSVNGGKTSVPLRTAGAPRPFMVRTLGLDLGVASPSKFQAQAPTE
jgi:hypothetical protein